MTRLPKDRVLGGAITRAPNGDLYTLQTASAIYPSQMTMQQIWANASQTRWPKTWDGKEPPEGVAQVIWWTDPIAFSCGRCKGSLGEYVAYHASEEYGIVENRSHHYHPRENFPPEAFASSPHDRLSPAKPRFWVSGEIGHRAKSAFAHFLCPRCGWEPTERNLWRLGRRLFMDRPSRYLVR